MVFGYCYHRHGFQTDKDSFGVSYVKSKDVMDGPNGGKSLMWDNKRKCPNKP